jgi:hypothetical protein
MGPCASIGILEPAQRDANGVLGDVARLIGRTRSAAPQAGIVLRHLDTWRWSNGRRHVVEPQHGAVTPSAASPYHPKIRPAKRTIRSAGLPGVNIPRQSRGL